MTYTIYATTRNNQGEPITIDTIVQADTMADARTAAQAANPQATTIRIYPATTDANGILEGAKLVVRRTTANMVEREGGAIQWELYNAIRCPEVTNESALECVNVASLALVEGATAGLPMDEQYRQAYLALNRYLYSIRAIRLDRTAMRTTYLEDVNGEIVSVNGQIAEIVKTGAHYIPQADADSDAADASKADALRAIMATLTPTQRRIAEYLARGYSERQIAKAMGRSRGTVSEHIKAVRRKAAELFPQGVR